MDPYRDWLNIDYQSQRPNRYELLGLPLFEADHQKIKAAFRKQYAVVRQYEVGNHGDEALHLLEEISAAYHCLTSDEQRSHYDDALRESQQRETVVEGVLLDTHDDEPSPLPAIPAEAETKPPIAAEPRHDQPHLPSKPPVARDMPPARPPVLKQAARTSAPPVTKPPIIAAQAVPQGAGEEVSHNAAVAVEEVLDATLVDEYTQPDAAASAVETVPMPRSKRPLRAIAGAAVVALLAYFGVQTFWGTSADQIQVVQVDPTLEPELQAVAAALEREVAAYRATFQSLETTRLNRLELILASMQYDSAAGLQQRLASAADDAQEALVVLEGGNTRILQHFDQARPLIAQAQQSAGPGPILDLANELAARILELEEALPTPDRLRTSYQSEFPAEIQQELALLTRLQGHTSSSPALSPEESQRAEVYLLQGNPQLLYLSLTVFSQTANPPAAFEAALPRIEWSNYTAAQQASLCQRLSDTGKPAAWQTVSNQFTANPQLCNALDSAWMVTEINKDSDRWKPHLPSMLQHLTDAKVALRLVAIGCQLQDPQFLGPLETAVESGVLKSSGGEVIDMVIAAQWKQAYGLIGKIAAANSSIAFDQVSVTALSRMLNDDPATALVLARRLVTGGNANQRKWALDVFAFSDEFSSAQLQQLLAAGKPTANTECLNLLLQRTDAKSLDIAAWLLANDRYISPAAISFQSLPAEVAANGAIMNPLYKQLWKGSSETRRWIVKQRFGIDLKTEVTWAMQRRAAHEQDIDDLDSVVFEAINNGRFWDLYTDGLDANAIGDIANWKAETDRVELLRQACADYTANVPNSAQAANLLQYVTGLQVHDQAYNKLVSDARRFFNGRPQIIYNQQFNPMTGLVENYPIAIYRVPKNNYEEILTNKSRFVTANTNLLDIGSRTSLTGL